MNKKITSSVLAALMIAGSTSFTAFAAMESGTVVIGNKAFDLNYANDSAHADEITNAIVAGGAVYVKDFNGDWIDNITGKVVQASVIPAVVYKNASKTVRFNAEDKDEVAKEASYPASFIRVTTGITNTSKVFYLAAVDQYGEAYSIVTDSSYKVTATVNGMPLTTEVALETDNNMAKITLAKDLFQNDDVVIKVEKYDKDATDTTAKLLSSITSIYTVGKDEIVAPRSILAVTPSVDTILVGDAAVTLTADVRDQFNNPFSDTGTDKTLVKWIVEEGKELIDVNGLLGNDLLSDNDTQSNKIVFKAIKPGTITISAYNVVNGGKATYTVKVGATKLTEVKETSESPVTKFNNEYVKYNKIAQNDGAILTPNMIKFHVTAKTEATDESDITVTAAFRGGLSANVDDIVISAKTTKVGTYEVTPFVGTTFEAEGTIKAEKFDVVTTLNPVATSFDEIILPKLKADTKLTANVVIRNTHNEVIDVAGKDVTTLVYKDGTLSNNVLVEKLDKDGQVAINESIKALRFDAIAAGNYTVRLNVNGTVATYDIEVSAEVTSLKSIELGNNIVDNSIIANAATPVYRVLSVKDNKDDEITPDTTGWIISTKNKTGADVSNFASIVYYKHDEKGIVMDADSADAEGIAVKFAPFASSVNNYAVNTILTVMVGNKELTASDVIKDTLNITVKAKSAVKTITLPDAAVTIIPGATVKKEIVVLDQYGKVITDPEMVTATAGDESKVTAVVSYDEVAKKMYVTYTGEKTGTETMVVKSAADSTIKATSNVIIGDNTFINSIGFNGYNYKVYNSNDDKLDQTVALTYKVNGGEMDIPADAISVITSSDLVTVTKDGSIINVKAKANTATTGIGDSDAVIKISILTANGKISSTYLTFSDNASVVNESTVVIKDSVDENAVVTGTQLVIGKDKDGNTIENETTGQITLLGTDQYGNKDIDVTSNTTWASANVGVATVSANGVVTAVKPGNTIVTGFYNGSLHTIEVEVPVAK